MLEKQLPYKYKVYDEIKKKILCGQYAPGDVLNERRLSEELGISRTPVREALQMLEQDGWLQIETYKGAIVQTFDLRYMKEVSAIRAALEECAVRQAVEHITDEELNELEALVEAQRATVENFRVETFMETDRSFHSYIYDLSKNKELIHLLRNYSDLFRFLGTQAALYTEERRNTTVSEHAAILECLRSRNAEAAVAAIRRHMEKTEQNMIARLSASGRA